MHFKDCSGLEEEEQLKILGEINKLFRIPNRQEMSLDDIYWHPNGEIWPNTSKDLSFFVSDLSGGQLLVGFRLDLSSGEQIYSDDIFAENLGLENGIYSWNDLIILRNYLKEHVHGSVKLRFNEEIFSPDMLPAPNVSDERIKAAPLFVVSNTVSPFTLRDITNPTLIDCIKLSLEQKLGMFVDMSGDQIILRLGKYIQFLAPYYKIQIASGDINSMLQEYISGFNLSGVVAEDFVEAPEIEEFLLAHQQEFAMHGLKINKLKKFGAAYDHVYLFTTNNTIDIERYSKKFIRNVKAGVEFISTVKSILT